MCTAFHEVSVYPKKELPFFILFTAGLCSFTALLALLTYQYPEPMGHVAKMVTSLKLRAEFSLNTSLPFKNVRRPLSGYEACWSGGCDIGLEIQRLWVRFQDNERN